MYILLLLTALAVLVQTKPIPAIDVQGKDPQTLHYDKHLSIRELLSKDKNFTQEMFNQLFTRPGYQGKGVLASLWHSDVEHLVNRLRREFPHVIKLGSIGKTVQGREILLVTLDARNYLVRQMVMRRKKKERLRLFKRLKRGFHAKPAILLTGRIHSRESITTTMALFYLVKLIHGGIVHQNQRDVSLMLQNKYLVIPTINVDGTNYIEENYMRRGVYYSQRKNLRKEGACKASHLGVDLNRNFDFNFGMGDAATRDSCKHSYGGRAAFSEPETRAIRDFIQKHRQKIKFVYNFHCVGHSDKEEHGSYYFIPFNSKLSNLLTNQYKDIYNIYQEIIGEVKFAENELVGPSNQVMNLMPGGAADDYITYKFRIPASDIELGNTKDFNKGWMPKTPEIAFLMINENLNWLEHTIEKLGN